jgi:ribosomal protein L3 glutamine methyltransferase
VTSRAPTTVADWVAHSEAALLRAGVSFGQGTTNAHDEAAWLVLHAAGLPLDQSDWSLPLSAAQSDAVGALLARRIDTRKPLAYLAGEAWLQGVPFFIDERSIVPRSLIAELVADQVPGLEGEGVLDAWLGEATRTVLDLCTGNGSLAVLAAMAWPEVTVDAADLSAEALALAQRNVHRHGLASRITLYQGDLFAPLARREHTLYDLILCNPPYVNADSMAALPPEFQAEPALALSGNVEPGTADGMDLVRRIVAEAARHLSDHGVLVIEIGHERAYFEAAFPRLATVWLPTSMGDDQVLLLTRAALLAG